MDESDDSELSGLIRKHATMYRASQELESSVRTEITLQAAAGRRPIWFLARHWPIWRTVGIGFGFGIVSTVLAIFMLGQPGESSVLERELVSSHVRSLMVSHLTDIASSDQHTIKPWFQGKLNYSPPVKDLAGEGFPLIGGRLDFLNGRTVAAIVYQRHGHLINVFIWPDSSNEHRKQTTGQGYNLLKWNVGNMQYWAVSDLNDIELKTLPSLLR